MAHGAVEGETWAEEGGESADENILRGWLPVSCGFRTLPHVQLDMGGILSANMHCVTSFQAGFVFLRCTRCIMSTTDVLRVGDHLHLESFWGLCILCFLCLLREHTKLAASSPGPKMRKRSGHLLEPLAGPHDGGDGDR